MSPFAKAPLATSRRKGAGNIRIRNTFRSARKIILFYLRRRGSPEQQNPALHTDGRPAHALRAMLERIMLEMMYEIPSREDVADVTINRAVVEGKKAPIVRRKQDKDAA